MSLTVSTAKLRPGIYRVTPAGSLDSDTYQILEDEVDGLLDAGAHALVFDLKDLEYISSMGVRVVAKAKKRLWEKGGEIAVMNMQPPIKKVFDIIRALPSERIFTSIEELDAYLDKMQRRAGS